MPPPPKEKGLLWFVTVIESSDIKTEPKNPILLIKLLLKLH
jgi:hypothetical protein